VAAGVTGVVGLVLSPLNAPSSTEDYHRRAEAALGGRAGYLPVWSWWDAAGFPELLAERVVAARVGAARGAVVVFTAHSLPVRVPGTEGYEEQLAALAGAVAKAADLDDHLVCWQSAGRTADEWLGPSLLELVASVDPTECPAVVVCPAGFVSDHLEVLFDVDIEAAGAAAQRGIAVTRTSSLNDDPSFLAILADVVQSVAAST
jgi:ferrochelatase